MKSARSVFVWGALGLALLVPLAAAAASPLLAWRDPVYIIAGFAGIIAFGLLLVQPLLIGRHLPGVSALNARKAHRLVGSTLVLAILVHVGGLWITSPPDVVDVLLFRSPTPFSDFGAIAMWSLFAAALLAVLRKPLALRPKTWRFGHLTFVTIAVACTIPHALLIEGTMEPYTKIALCVLVGSMTAKVLFDLKVFTTLFKTKTD